MRDDNYVCDVNWCFNSWHLFDAFNNVVIIVVGWNVSCALLLFVKNVECSGRQGVAAECLLKM